MRKRFFVHRLVAEAFLSNTDGKPEVDHIVPISMGGTNEASNLRYCSRVENNNNPITRKKNSEAKKGKTGAESNRAIPIVGINKETGEEVLFYGGREAERALGISQAGIIACCKGKRKSAGGFYWRYAVC